MERGDTEVGLLHRVWAGDLPTDWGISATDDGVTGGTDSRVGEGSVLRGMGEAPSVAPQSAGHALWSSLQVRVTLPYPACPSSDTLSLPVCPVESGRVRNIPNLMSYKKKRPPVGS